MNGLLNVCFKTFAVRGWLRIENAEGAWDGIVSIADRPGVCGVWLGREEAYGGLTAFPYAISVATEEGEQAMDWKVRGWIFTQAPWCLTRPHPTILRPCVGRVGCVPDHLDDPSGDHEVFGSAAMAWSRTMASPNMASAHRLPPMSRAPHVIDALNAAVRVLNANRDSREALTQVRDALRRTGEVEPWPDDQDDRFVSYGTLAPGRPNHQVVADIAGLWFTGWVEGDLYELGWGAADGYPAMVWRPGGKRIDVHVLESSELSQHWARLDEFEGVGYRRVLVPVFRHDAPPTVGHIYEARLDEVNDA